MEYVFFLVIQLKFFYAKGTLDDWFQVDFASMYKNIRNIVLVRWV